MKVAPTGLIFNGICSIKSDDCVAKNIEFPITSVWIPPGNSQVNVCRPCLHYLIKKGEWKIDGASVRDLNKVIDLAIIDEDGKLSIVIEVKNKFPVTSSWVENFFNKELLVGLKPTIKFLILSVPKQFYILDVQQNELKEINNSGLLSKYFQKNNFSEDSISVEDSKEFIFNYKKVVEKHFKYQKVIREFFEDIINQATKVPNELSFLEPILNNSKVKEEYVIE